MTTVYGLAFLSDDPAVRSEHRSKSALAYVASYKTVRAALMKVAEKVHKLSDKVDANEGRTQLLIDSQLRVDETLHYFKKLIDRQLPPAQQ